MVGYTQTLVFIMCCKTRRGIMIVVVSVVVAQEKSLAGLKNNRCLHSSGFFLSGVMEKKGEEKAREWKKKE